MKAARFGKISEIEVSDESTWKGKVFLTFDIDWCEDFVLEPLLTWLNERMVKATFFVTHETPLLEQMRRDDRFELGIHPNFNRLLEGNELREEGYREIVARCLDIVPEAVSVRSHSLTSSSRILSACFESGLRFDCNQFTPWWARIDLRPYRSWCSPMIHVPHFWEDDLNMSYGAGWEVSQMFGVNGLRVFDFHPIHVFLNTEVLDRYENSRDDHRNQRRLVKHRNRGPTGTAEFLGALCDPQHMPLDVKVGCK